MKRRKYRVPLRERIRDAWGGPTSIREFREDLKELKEEWPRTYRNFIVSCVAFAVSILTLILKIAVELG